MSRCGTILTHSLTHSLTHLVPYSFINDITTTTTSVMTDPTAVQSFDAYQQHVLAILKENESLKSQTSELSAQVTNLSKEKIFLVKTLLSREADLDRMSSTVLQNMKHSVETLKSIQQETIEKKKMSEIQYELDICLSCKRSLERDCMLQKNENQRLTCLNSQLSQEIKTLKYNNNSR